MADAGGLTAVLDWCNAAAGDPRADVARTHSLLALAPVRPGAPPNVAALRQALLAAWQAGYEEEAGPPEDMALFHAWAGAFALQDLIPKLGRPGIWLQQSDLDRLAQWTAGWKERAGLS
jgi:aminoglycoside phosphotransferase (APT) family kinase protein